MNTDLRKKAKHDLEKDFFKLMKNAGFGKTMQSMRSKQKYLTCHNRKKKNQLVSEPNYHTTNFFSENLLAIEMRKNRLRAKIYNNLMNDGSEVKKMVGKKA